MTKDPGKFFMIDGPLAPQGNVESKVIVLSPCHSCGRYKGAGGMLTEINPEGGYGRPQFLCCDDCMMSGRWDHWKAEHWPNWPEPRKY